MLASRNALSAFEPTRLRSSHRRRLCQQRASRVRAICSRVNVATLRPMHAKLQPQTPCTKAPHDFPDGSSNSRRRLAGGRCARQFAALARRLLWRYQARCGDGPPLCHLGWPRLVWPSTSAATSATVSVRSGAVARASSRSSRSPTAPASSAPSTRATRASSWSSPLAAQRPAVCNSTSTRPTRP